MLAGDILLFSLPLVLQDCILQRLRPLDVISLRLSCKAGLDRLKSHIHLKFAGTSADVDCWQRVTPDATHVTLCGVIPTLQQLSNLPHMPQMPLLPALNSLVMLVVQPHHWPLDVPVYVTLTSWCRLPQMQVEVWSADKTKLNLPCLPRSPTATNSQPLMMPAIVQNPLSCQAQSALVLINNSEQETKVVWRSGVGSLWIVTQGHLRILQVTQFDLLQGIKYVCIAYPKFLSDGAPGTLNVMAFLSQSSQPLHCSLDDWLEAADLSVEQLGLERFTHCGMNFVVSQGYRNIVLEKYAGLTDGVYTGLAPL